MSDHLTFGSLFAGIGGLDLGLERAGLRCKFQVEIDPYARRVLAKHWPDVPKHDDVKTFPPSEGDWHVDLIAAGFPCQDVSYAGKGAGLDGERSGLWWDAARVIRTLQPRYVLLENVAALLTRGLDSVLGTLASFGYDAEWHCIPAAYVGAPHIRDRVFILGYAERPRADAFSEAGRPRDAAGEPGGESGRLADADRPRQPQPCGALAEVGGWAGNGCETLADASRHRSRIGFDPRGLVVGHGPDGDPNERDESANRPRDGCQSSGLDVFRETVGRAQWERDPADDPQSGVVRMAHGIPNRVDRLRGLGNAVVPHVAQFVGRRLVEFHRSTR